MDNVFHAKTKQRRGINKMKVKIKRLGVSQ